MNRIHNKTLSALLGAAVLLGASAFLAAPAQADPLVVTGVSVSSANALALAQALAGSSIVVDTASMTGSCTAGGACQQGTFTGGTGIIPFDTGVLLTSGNALAAPGPNNSDSSTQSWGTAGDSQLDTLSGGVTHDANVLTFTFHKANASDPDVLSFQYVFASEEYNEYVGSAFNDVFGFFLNGNNIALIPSTTTAVAINNVNCGSNSAYYASNDPFDSTDGGCNGAFTSYNTQYDGIAGGLGSLSLFASGTLNPGTNTISLKIADTTDSILDSGVFLKGGSFVAAPPPPPAVPEPSTLVMLGTGVLGLAGSLKRKYLS
jgi:hypothetical protein